MQCSNALREHMMALQLTVLALYSFSCVSCNTVVAMSISTNSTTTLLRDFIIQAYAPMI